MKARIKFLFLCLVLLLLASKVQNHVNDIKVTSVHTSTVVDLTDPINPDPHVITQPIA